MRNFDRMRAENNISQIVEARFLSIDNLFYAFNIFTLLNQNLAIGGHFCKWNLLNIPSHNFEIKFKI